MPLDPQAAAFLAGLPARRPRAELTLQQNRATDLAIGGLLGDKHAVASVRDLDVETPAHRIPIRVYRPTSGNDELPVFIYCHGGGWVLGNLDGCDTICRDLCREAGCVVVSVDYRLAPEHRFPAALDDCLSVIRDVASRHDAYKVDPQRIAVGGDSAGGNLSAVAAQQLRRSGPKLIHQVLVYPIVDAEPERWASYREFADGFSMTAADMRWYLDQYVPRHSDRRDLRVAPIRAADLSGLPAATIITAECDVLRDEGEAYARRLADAGVPVRHRRFDGMFHPFFRLAGALDAAREARTWVAQSLAEAFSVGRSSR
jgi:acetyl esterase